jgi:hypothetical protein
MPYDNSGASIEASRLSWQSVGLPAIPQVLRGGDVIRLLATISHHRTAGADLLKTLMLSTGSAPIRVGGSDMF